MRRTRIFSWVLAAALVPAGCAQVREPVDDYIVIGMDEDSTGPGASYSTIAGDTVRATVDRLNAEGGIGGREVRRPAGSAAGRRRRNWSTRAPPP